MTGALLLLSDVFSPRLPRNLVRSCLYLCVIIVISDTRAGGQGYK